MQTLSQAAHNAVVTRNGAPISRPLYVASTALHGCPVGSWPETEQARRVIADQLPHRAQRSYTVDEFVALCYAIERGRYVRRSAQEVLRRCPALADLVGVTPWAPASRP